MTTLMFDIELKRPACVLLQAAHGCDYSLLRKYGFDAKTWLLAPTPGMRRVSGTDEEWRRLAATK